MLTKVRVLSAFKFEKTKVAGRHHTHILPVEAIAVRGPRRCRLVAQMLAKMHGSGGNEAMASGFLVWAVPANLMAVKGVHGNGQM